MEFRNRLACLLSVLVLSACGGGNNNKETSTKDTSTVTPVTASVTDPVASPDTAPPTTANTITGGAFGNVVARDTDQPLSNVQVFVAEKTFVTAADGSFKYDAIPTSERTVLRFVKSGYADTFVTTSIKANTASKLTARMAPISATITYDNNAGTTLADSTSPASVSLSPSSLVNNVTGAAPVGSVIASIGNIDPGANPANMPGDYRSSAGDTIESFGAITVQLRDSAGNRLNLAPGQTSTIRIPLSSRSTKVPPSIPLYYFNETTGFWVEEGSATLAGIAPNQYYQGTVTHFTVWNADIRIDTVLVKGCLINSDNSPASFNFLQSNGIDYSGIGATGSDLQGNFSLPIRRNSQAKIEVVGLNNSTAIVAGPSASDITLPACLVVQPSDVPVKPSFLVLPRATNTLEYSDAAFFVFAVGTDLQYQWLRNGQPISGETSGAYKISGVTSADNGALFSVVVSNQVGSITSDPVSLTVVAGPSADSMALKRLMNLPFEFADLGNAALVNFRSAEGNKWANPALVCTTGSASGTLNGQAVPANTAIAAGSGTVTGLFNNCVSEITGLDIAISGSTTDRYTIDVGLVNGSSVSQLVNLRRVYTTTLKFDASQDITGNGSIATSNTSMAAAGKETEISIVTPGAGSTLRNNLNGQVVSFVSGDTQVTTVEAIATKKSQTTIVQNNLTYTINGNTYVLNGAFDFGANQAGINGTGQIVLTKNGIQVGRMFATPQGIEYEVTGQLEAFGRAGLTSPTVFKARIVR